MEIELYVRMLALSEPKSILQWQLTSDYALLAGGGVYGDTTPLRPTQRLWNLKQLASTPERVHHLPMHCHRPISCAALGNVGEGNLALHFVNNGAPRRATITGIPEGVKALRVWVTGAERVMQEVGAIAVERGRAQLILDAASYVTLIAMRCIGMRGPDMRPPFARRCVSSASIMLSLPTERSTTPGCSAACVRSAASRTCASSPAAIKE